MREIQVEWGEFIKGFVGPLALFTGAVLVSDQYDPMKNATPVVIATLVALGTIVTAPRYHYRFLSQFQMKGAKKLWIKFSLITLILGAIMASSMSVANRHSAFIVYSIIGCVVSVSSLAHLLGAVLSDGKPIQQENATRTQAPRPPTPTPAAKLPELEKTLEFDHGGFYEQYLCFSDDGRRLATWEPDKIQCFRTVDGEQVGELSGGRVPVCFDSEGRLVTAGNKSVEVWSLPSFEREACYNDPDAAGKAADSTWEVLQIKTAIYVVSTRTGFVAPWAGTSWDCFNPYRMNYSKSRELIFSSLGDSAGSFSTKTGELLWQSPSVGRDVTAAVVSSDGEVAAFGSMGGSIFVVDMASNEIVGRLGVPGEIRCMSMAPDGRHVAVGCGDLLSDVIVFNVTSGPSAVAGIKYSNNWAVEFSPDGKTLAVGTDNKKVSLWKRSVVS